MSTFNHTGNQFFTKRSFVFPTGLALFQFHAFRKNRWMTISSRERSIRLASQVDPIVSIDPSVLVNAIAILLRQIDDILFDRSNIVIVAYEKSIFRNFKQNSNETSSINLLKKKFFFFKELFPKSSLCGKCWWFRNRRHFDTDFQFSIF